MNEVSDEQLAEGTRRMNVSDEAAGAELFRAYYPRLFGYALRLTRSEAAAEDVVQDAFLRLWRMRERLDPRKSIDSLLFVMVRNLALNLPKRPNDELGAIGDAAAHHPPQRLDAELLATRMRDWIDALPDRRREAFHLSRFEGLKYAEIAQIMDVSVRTVENHIRLALQHLRDRLHEYDPSLLKS